MDEEFELPEFNPRECVKQQISVPFLWEVKPGAPKGTGSFPSQFRQPSHVHPQQSLLSVCHSSGKKKPGKSLQDTSPFNAMSDHADFSVSSYPLNPFVAEGEEEYSLGFDLEAFGFPDSNKASGAPECADGSSRHGTWYSFSETEDYSNSSGDNSAGEFQFPRAPSEKSWEVANDDDLLANPWSPPRSAFTLEELMMLSRKLSCGQGMPVDVRKKNLSSMELIKKFLIACA